MPNDAEDRKVITEILAKVGIHVETIPESSSKSCDLLAEDAEHCQYLLEIKSFHDDEAIAKTLNEGNIHSKVSHFDCGLPHERWARRSMIGS